MSSHDIVFIILTIPSIILTIFLCIAIYYLIKILNNISKAINGINQNLESVNEILLFIKSKLAQGASNLMLVVEGFKYLLEMYKTYTESSPDDIENTSVVRKPRKPKI